MSYGEPLTIGQLIQEQMKLSQNSTSTQSSTDEVVAAAMLGRGSMDDDFVIDWHVNPNNIQKRRMNEIHSLYNVMYKTAESRVPELGKGHEYQEHREIIAAYMTMVPSNMALPLRIYAMACAKSGVREHAPYLMMLINNYYRQQLGD